MKIESVDRIPFPRDLVFSTLRDKLPELLPHLPNVEAIEERSRERREDGAVETCLWWKAKSDIPRVARAVVTPDMLHWLDFATWREEDWSCQWRLQTNFFTDRVSCRGRNLYTETPEGHTELAILGDLTVDAKDIKGVPLLMAGAVGAAIERFVVALITPNFKRLNQGLTRYLEDAQR